MKKLILISCFFVSCTQTACSTDEQTQTCCGFFTTVRNYIFSQSHIVEEQEFSNFKALEPNIREALTSKPDLEFVEKASRHAPKQLSTFINNTIKDKDGLLRLHSAIENNDLQMIQHLIDDVGVDVNLQDSNTIAPIHYTALCNHPEIIPLLIEKGANVNLQNSYKGTALHYAADNNWLEIARLLIEKGTDVNLQNSGKSAPIHGYNSLPMILLLIEAGARINVQNEYGYTPLHDAVYRNNEPIIELLIKKNANLNLQNCDGQTPLYFATSPQVVQLLINAKANLNIQNKYGDTALHHTARYDQQEIAQCLLKGGAKRNIQGLCDKTAREYIKSEKMRRMFDEADATSIQKLYRGYAVRKKTNSITARKKHIAAYQSKKNKPSTKNHIKRKKEKISS